MRKVTKEIVRAFLNGERHTIGNSSTDGTTLFLHGNAIAKKGEGGITISAAGWKTATTKERLNGIPGVRIVQKKGEWYLNGMRWDGLWTWMGRGARIFKSS